MEDKAYTDGESRWGNRYRKKAGVTIKEEWTGCDKFEEDCCKPCECVEEFRATFDQIRQNVSDSQKTLNELGK